VPRRVRAAGRSEGSLDELADLALRRDRCAAHAQSPAQGDLLDGRSLERPRSREELWFVPRRGCPHVEICSRHKRNDSRPRRFVGSTIRDNDEHMTEFANLPATLRLGDLEVPRLGFGAMQIPGPFVWGEPTD